MSVPVDSRGEAFDRTTCCRSGGYWVGPKGNEIKYSSYDDALDALRCMDVPRWRRPNKQGNWGIVAGVRWV
jgi:hypothetical protein